MNTITIGIPTYNRKDIVTENVQQMLSNNVDGYELVIIDNNSSDGTYDQLSKIHDKRLKVFQNDTNIGFIRNFYTLIDKVSTPYILMLSDEDVVNIDKLQSIICDIRSDYSYYSKEVGAVIFNKKNSFKFDVSNVEHIFDLFANSAYMSGILFNVKALLTIDDRDYDNIYPHIFCLAKLFGDYVIKASDISIYNFGAIRAASSMTLYFYPQERFKQLQQQIVLLNKNDKIDFETKAEVVFKLYHFKFWSIRNYEILYREKNFRATYAVKDLRLYYSRYIRLFNDYFLDIIKQYKYRDNSYARLYILEQNNLLMMTLYLMQQLENIRLNNYELVLLSDKNETSEDLNYHIEMLNAFGFVIDKVIYNLGDINANQVLLKRRYNGDIYYEGFMITSDQISYGSLYHIYGNIKS